MSMKVNIRNGVLLLLTMMVIFAIFVVIVPPGDQDNPPGHSIGRYMQH